MFVSVMGGTSVYGEPLPFFHWRRLASAPFACFFFMGSDLSLLRALMYPRQIFEPKGCLGPLMGTSCLIRVSASASFITSYKDTSPNDIWMVAWVWSNTWTSMICMVTT